MEVDLTQNIIPGPNGYPIPTHDSFSDIQPDPVLKIIGYRVSQNIRYYPVFRVEPTFRKDLNIRYIPNFPDISDIPGNTRKYKTIPGNPRQYHEILGKTMKY